MGMTTGTASFADPAEQATQAAGESEIEPPKGWEALPELAERAQSAAAGIAGSEIDVVAQAWGDPPTGAFGLRVTARSDDLGGSAAEVGAGLRTALEATDAKVVDWSEAEQGVTLVFEWGAFRGIARVGTTTTESKGAPRATLLACFYSARQPVESKSTCETWVRRWEGMP